MKRILVSTMMLAAGMLAARAQDTAIVHIPSAYKDYIETNGVSLSVGYFGGNTGDAGVGPQGAPIVGLGYYRHLGSAARAFAQLSYTPSQRTLVNPALPPATRNVATISAPLVLADVGLNVDITGEKTWHGIIPTAGFSLGFAFGSSAADSGGYKFGAQFALGIGVGMKYVLKGPWVLRLDLWDHLWQLQYPSTYFLSSTPVLDPKAPDKQWTNNGVFTIGVTYILAH